MEGGSFGSFGIRELTACLLPWSPSYLWRGGPRIVENGGPARRWKILKTMMRSQVEDEGGRISKHIVRSRRLKGLTG